MGSILTLRINLLGENALPQLTAKAAEVCVKIVDVVEPSTMSVVVIVELLSPTQQADQTEEPVSHISTESTPKLALKLYDRQFSSELRDFKGAGPATELTEQQYITFLRDGSLSRFLDDYEGSGRWAYEEWDVPSLEAYFHFQSVEMHDVEVEIYDRLVDLQGLHIPTFHADVRLAPQQALSGAQRDPSLAEYTEVQAILMEYIPGFPIFDMVTETPESDWPVICDQAVDGIRKIIDHDFVNIDINNRSMLVKHGENEKTYQVFFIDFAFCRFRSPSDSDEVWRERKRQKDEEGAVGYCLTNCISFAKGKKGKRYKGKDPLPWTYIPSTRFEGEYIELYSQLPE